MANDAVRASLLTALARTANAAAAQSTSDLERELTLSRSTEPGEEFLSNADLRRVLGYSQQPTFAGY